MTELRDSELDGAALDKIRAICQRFTGADEGDIQGRPLFRVGRRRFAIFNGRGAPPRRRWNSSGRSLHFLADPEEIPALGQDERLSISPHHGDRGWLAISLEDDGRVDWDEIAELLESGFRRVAPRRLRRRSGSH